MSQKKIAITGATGFLGSHLLYHLLSSEPEADIVALHRDTSSIALFQKLGKHYPGAAAEFDRLRWVEGDLLDVPSLESFLEDADQLYHCAAVVAFAPRQRQAMSQINVEGTANIVNVAMHCGVEKMVHMSSVAALGRSVNRKVINEDFFWEKSNLNTQYGISKFQSEQEVWRAIAEGLEAVVFNPGIILGPGDWQEGSCHLFQWVDQGQTFYPPGSTGWVDVRDVCELAIIGMRTSISGERFVTVGANESYDRVFQLIARGLQCSAPSVQANAWMQAIAWRWAAVQAFFTGESPLLTRETAIVSAQDFHFLPDKSRETFDFNYRSLEDTIQWTATTYKEEKTA